MKVEQLKYDTVGHRRLFYVAEDVIHSAVTAHIYTAAEGRKEAEFESLEFEVYSLDFAFRFCGKYIFIIFEDGLKTLILIVTIG